MTPTPAALADFLLARIAEDAQRARAVGPTRAWITDAPRTTVVATPEGEVLWRLEAAQVGTVAGALFEHLAAHQPGRVLAECEAKLRIVELAETITSDYDGEWGSGERDEDERWPSFSILRALAAPYADHPDYREEWRL